MTTTIHRIGVAAGSMRAGIAGLVASAGVPVVLLGVDQASTIAVAAATRYWR